MKTPVSLCYAKVLGLTLIRNHSIWVSTILIAALSCIFLILRMPVNSEDQMYDDYQSQLAYNKQLDFDATYQAEAPEELKAYFLEERNLLEKALAEWDTPSHVSSLADYMEANAWITRKSYEDGTLTSDLSMVLATEGSAQVMRNIANLSNPILYNYTSDLPPMFYLLDMLSSLPYFVWYIPLFIAISICAKERDGDTLLASIPLSQTRTMFAIFLLLLFLSLALLFAEWLPALVISLFKNGPDDLAYPIAFVTNETLYTSTVGLSLLKWVAGFAAESALFSLIAAICLTFKMSRVSQAIIAAFLIIPMLPGYLAGTIPVWLLKYLPSTYLEATRFIGPPTMSACLLDSGPGCTFEAGIVCVLAWTLVVLILGILACALSRIARNHASGVRHA